MYNPKIVVSLTSYPGRINTIHHTLDTIFSQTVKADHIFLWLAKPQFPNLTDDLPKSLLSFCSKGLEIRWCDEDIKSHKKYFYVMQEYPEDIIILFDDDLHYDSNVIERLMNSYTKNPRAVSAIITRIIKFDNDSNKLAPFATWYDKRTIELANTPSLRLFANSGHGSLYPPHCMHPDLFRIDLIKRLSLYCDESWLKVMQVLNNTPVVLAYTNEKDNKFWPVIKNSQENTLTQINLHEGQKDVQFNDALNMYNDFFGTGDTLFNRIYNDFYINEKALISSKKLIFAVNSHNTNADEYCLRVLQYIKKYSLLDKPIPETFLKVSAVVLERILNKHYMDVKSGKKIGYAAYGVAAKRIMKELLNSNIRPDLFWDINSDENDEIDGIPIVKPDYESLAADDTVLLLITRESIEREVRESLAKTPVKTIVSYLEVVDRLADFYFHKYVSGESESSLVD